MCVCVCVCMGVCVRVSVHRVMSIRPNSKEVVHSPGSLRYNCTQHWVKVAAVCVSHHLYYATTVKHLHHGTLYISQHIPIHSTIFGY